MQPRSIETRGSVLYEALPERPGFQWPRGSEASISAERRQQTFPERGTFNADRDAGEL